MDYINYVQSQKKLITEAMKEAEKDTKNYRRIVVNPKWDKPALEAIKTLIMISPVSSMKELKDQQLLLTFEKFEDCKKLRHKLEKLFPKVIVIEEQEEDAEILIDNIGNILPKLLEIELETITTEKPDIIRILEVEKRKKWRAHVRLTSFAMLMLQAFSGCEITIAGLKTEYYQLPDWAIRMRVGREECIRPIFP